MQPISHILSPFQSEAYGDVGLASPFEKEISDIDAYLQLAQTASGPSTMKDKRDVFQNAFRMLCDVANQRGELPEELRPKLYTLLLQYASQMRYSRDASGFRDTARLMTLSLLLQCVDLQLFNSNYNWQQAHSLEELMQNLPDVQNEHQQSLEQFYHPDFALSIASTLEAHPEKRQILADTLVKLAYSYQNMAPLADPIKNKLFQIGLNEMALSAIGQSIEQTETLADFMYNRCCFMTGLDFANRNSQECILAQIDSYEPIQKICLENLGPASAQYLGKLSQIENMRGLLTMRIPGHSPAVVLEHFRSAVEHRQNMPEPTDIEQRWAHRNLLNNVRTGLIHSLLRQASLENIQEASKHAAEMAEFMLDNSREGRTSPYSSGYSNTLTQFARFLPQVPELLPIIFKALNVKS